MRRLPDPVTGATAVLGLLVVLWSVAVPLYRAVDEPQHLSTALRLADGGGYPPPGSARLVAQVAASYPFADFPGGDERTFVATVQVRAEPPARFPSLRELRSLPVPPDQADQADQMTQHPPLWPLLAAGEIRALRLEDVPADLAVVLLRLLQGALLLPLPWLAARTARLLGATAAGQGAAAFLPVAVPQLLHIGASVTDGDLLLVEFAALTPLLVLMARGDRRLRVTGAVGLLLAAALLTKAFALALLPFALLAVVLGRRNPGAGRAATTVGGLALLGGWWYPWRILHDGALQPSGYPPGVVAMLRGSVPAGQAVEVFTGSLLKTAWVDLGWLETPAPFRVVLPVWATVTVLVLVGVLRARRRVEALLVLVPVVVLVAMVVLAGVSTWSRLHSVLGAQGRYLFPGLTGVAAVAGTALSGRRAAGLPLLTVASHALTLHLAGVHFWHGGTAAQLDWSPLPVPLLAGCAAGAVLLCLTATAGLLRPAGPPRP